MFFFAKDQTSARAAQGFLRRRGYIIRHRHWRRMQARDDRPGDVRNVREHPRADALRNLADPFEVDDARISRRATDDQSWPLTLRDMLQLVIIDRFRFARDAIVGDFV